MYRGKLIEYELEKPAENSWVYGYYVSTGIKALRTGYNDKHFIINSVYNNVVEANIYEVHEDSVCECTGLLDFSLKNFVYESDIIRYINPYTAENNEGWITWNYPLACFQVEKRDYELEQSPIGDLKILEVIGNVIDNVPNDW